MCLNSQPRRRMSDPHRRMSDRHCRVLENQYQPEFKVSGTLDIDKY